jgi:hypothetical protein
MISPETIRKQLEGKGGGGLAVEGMAPQLNPSSGKKFKRIFLVVVVVIVSAMLAEKGCQKAKADRVSAADAEAAARKRAMMPATKPAAPISLPSFLGGDRARQVYAEWTTRDRAGLVIGASHYTVERGDFIDGVTVGLLGARWIDIAIDGRHQRLYVSDSGAKEAFSGAGSVGNSGSTGSALPPGSGTGLAGRSASKHIDAADGGYKGF